MNSEKLEASKKWYVEAVRSALILNYCATGEEADNALSAYQLQTRLDKYPEAQLHYDVEDIADEIVEGGFLQKSCVLR